MNVFPDRVMLVLVTTSAVLRLSWKEQLTSSACVECKRRATWTRVAPLGRTFHGIKSGRAITYFLLQDVKVNESILNSTIPMKLRPTDPLQTTVTLLPEEDSPYMVSRVTLATVILVSRVWSPGKNTIVVLEVKYSSASCAYSESVAQWVL